jgi:hypothetical protein
MSSSLPRRAYTHCLSSILAEGTVLDFDNRIAPAAIVYAENAYYRSGGGVDVARCGYHRCRPSGSMFGRTGRRDGSR